MCVNRANLKKKTKRITPNKNNKTQFNMRFITAKKPINQIQSSPWPMLEHKHFSLTTFLTHVCKVCTVYARRQNQLCLAYIHSNYNNHNKDLTNVCDRDRYQMLGTQ